MTRLLSGFSDSVKQKDFIIDFLKVEECNCKVIRDHSVNGD